MGRWYRGDTARITFPFSDFAGAAADADGAVSMTILSGNEERVIVPATVITENKAGTGLYYYDHAPEDAGHYIAVATAMVDAKPAVRLVRFKVLPWADVQI